MKFFDNTNRRSEPSGRLRPDFHPLCRKVLDCASPPALSMDPPPARSAMGLAQSKTLPRSFTLLFLAANT